MTANFFDKECYHTEDEVVFTAMLDAYASLYNQACTNKNYQLCDALRLDLANYIAGMPARIRIEQSLFPR